MPDPKPTPDLSPAAEVFAEFLAASDAGSADIEAYCRDHPLLADRLRRLHADWIGLDRALGGKRGTGDGERYELLECIATGGMGSVHRVYDRHLRRELAMKVLRTERGSGSEHGSSDPRAVSRFLDEARITGQLQHPGIPPVHDLGVDRVGRLYFTMPLVPGCTLTRIAERLQRHDPEWPLPRVLGILLKACEAVAFAHAQGVIHRDLKPGNVMVGQFGEAYVMDWGLARVLGDAADDHPGVASERAELTRGDPGSPLVTRDGEIVGTPAYMPPEQARGELANIGPRADVYAAGAILYHLLAGAPPYGDERASTTSVLHEVLAGPPAPLASRAKAVPPELAAICSRAMAPESGDRYADMGGFAADLRAYLEGRVVSAHSVGTWAQLRKLVARNKATTVAAFAAAAALVVGLVASMAQARDAEASNALSLAAVEKMLAEVGTTRLQDVPRAWPVRQTLITEAIGLYEQILARRPADVATQERLARSWRDLGQVRSKLGDLDGAEAALAKAGAGFADLARRHPGEARFVVASADTANVLAAVHESRGQTGEAERNLRHALGLLAGMGSSTPPVLELQVNAHGQLGSMLLVAERFEEALIEQRQAVALARRLCELEDQPERRESLARRVDQMGLTWSRSRRPREAEPCHAEAVAILTALHAAEPDDEPTAASLACALGNLGLCRKRLGDRAAGEALQRRSVDTWRKIVADHPEVPRYHSLLSTALVDLALTIEGADAALACLDEALAAIGRAIAMSPDAKGFRTHLQFSQRQRLMKLCALRRHGEVVAGAAALAATDPQDASQPLLAAQFVAHAIGYVAEDATLSGDGRDALHARYADAVVAHLRTAIDRGCRTLAKFEAPHFAPVREHAGFQALLAELRSGAQSAR